MLHIANWIEVRLNARKCPIRPMGGPIITSVAGIPVRKNARNLPERTNRPTPSLMRISSDPDLVPGPTGAAELYVWDASAPVTAYLEPKFGGTGRGLRVLLRRIEPSADGNDEIECHQEHALEPM